VLFRLKALLEAQLDQLARAITEECGKTLAEASGELRRGIENVEVACGIPLMMQGVHSEDIARGIDEEHDPAAARRRRRDHAVQLPRDDSALVPPVRRRLREHRGAQAVGEDADDRGAAGEACSRRRTAARASSTSSTAARRRSTRCCDHPEGPRHQLRRLVAVARHVYSRAAASGKARAVPGRREESRRGPPGRGDGR
jgi:hypothetical protein